MPVQVQGPDGRRYQFPDGTDKKSAIAYFKKKGIGVPKPPSALHPEARTVGNYLKEGAYGTGRGLRNDAQGLYQAFTTNPVDTVKGMASQINEADTAQAKEWQETAGQPLGRRLGATALTALEKLPVMGTMVERAEQGGERMGSPEALGAAMEGATTFAAPELVGKGIAKIIPKAAETARAVTGTGPRATADLIKETKNANEASAAEAAENNAKQEGDRKVDLKKHFDRTKQAKEANVQAEAGPERKAALSRGVEQLDVKFKDDLIATEKDVRAQAGAKYDSVRKATQGQILPPAELQAAVRQAQGMIQGSSENIKMFNDILSKAPVDYVMSGGAKFGPGSPIYESVKATPEGLPNPSAPVNFSDLQGYYSELGEKLSSGNLPGDVYLALKSLQESISGKMQQMADKAGVGPQLSEARSFYSQYMKAFRDHSSPLYKARTATERGKAIGNLAGKDQTGIQALARYNPDLARRANTIRRYQAEAKTIPAKPGKLKSLPRLSEKDPLSSAQFDKIGADDITTRKAENLAKRADSIRNRGGGLASTFAVMAAIRSAMHGDVMGIGEDIAVRGAFGVGKAGLANLLESKPVVDWLTRATPEDLEQIPPDMRASIGPIVQEAQKRGIKVSPALLTGAAVSGQRRNGVGALLQPQ